MSDDTVELSEQIRLVSDELAIRRTVSRLARAQDDKDRDAYRTCFTERVMLTEAAVIADWTPKEISVDELADMYFNAIGDLEFGHHMLFNYLIDIDGDNATCDADLFAIAAQGNNGSQNVSMNGGRYALKLKRIDGEWRIYERSVRLRYAI